MKRAKHARFWGGSLDGLPTTVTAECSPETAQIIWLAIRNDGLEGRVFLSLPEQERLHAELGRLLTARRAELAELDRLTAEEATSDFAAGEAR